MNKIIHYCLRAICIVVGLAIFLALPFLWIGQDGQVQFNIAMFPYAFKKTIMEFVQINDSTIFEPWTKSALLHGYLYTMKLFWASTFLMIGIGFLLTAIVLLSPYKIRRKLKTIINFSEAIPDLLVIFLIQITVITLYQKTGIKLLQLYGFTGTPYFTPIVVIAFLPSFFLAQFLIRAFEEEQEKDYAILARSKGLTFSRIYVTHMLRNIFPMFIVQMRSLIWILLSNLFLVEYLFGLKAYTHQIANLNYMNALEAIVDIILFIFPIIIIDLIIRLISRISRGKEGAEA